VPIETQYAWLTEETYERARAELAQLLTRRTAGSFGEHGGAKHCARRIRRLQELLGDAVVGYEPPDDGVAEPGMVLTVRYEADGLTDRFLMADREEDIEDDLPVCSPQSPLGTALSGAKAGDRRAFRVPGGDVMTVTLERAAPYRHAQ
jgi:transcription elongation factor GreA